LTLIEVRFTLIDGSNAGHQHMKISIEDLRKGAGIVGQAGGAEAAIVAQFGKDLSGIDGAAAGERLHDRRIGMVLQDGGDGRGELLNLGDEGREDGDEATHEVARGLGLGRRPPD